MRPLVTSVTYPLSYHGYASEDKFAEEGKKHTMQALKTDPSLTFEAVLLILDRLNYYKNLNDSSIYEIFSCEDDKTEHDEEYTKRKGLLLTVCLKYIGDNQVKLSKTTLIFLLEHLWKTEGHFQVIFQEMLRPLIGGNIEDFYPCLRFFLRNVGTKFTTSTQEEISIVNKPLAFGETPLMAACKNRRSGAIALLLRHGATPYGDWLSYTHALQVLLFSPHKCCIFPKDKETIETCVTLLVSATGSVDFSKLKRLEQEDYHPTHDKWETLLDVNQACVPSSLKKLCKLQIINVLIKDNRLLSASIAKLPLPQSLRNYIDIKQPL